MEDIEEIWVSARGIDNATVSNLGEIKREKMNCQGVSIGIHTVPQRIDKDGYMLITVPFNKQQKTYKVHRIVLWSFTGIDGSGMQCNHINGNRDDNRLENLEWCSVSENHLHKCRKLGGGSGACHYRSKLSSEQVAEIRDRYMSHQLTQQELADLFGVSRVTIRRAVTGKSYRTSPGEISIGKEFHAKIPGRTSCNGTTREMVDSARLMFSRGHTKTEISRALNTSTKTVNNILNGAISIAK